ncbi:MAG: CAP domain-containing protein, partial [Actinomycetota bacterium]
MIRLARGLSAQWAIALLVLLAVVAAPPFSPSAAASAGEESQSAAMINGSRGSSGLPALAVHSGLSGIARRQAARMAASGSLYHNPNLRGEVAATMPGWQAMAENIGVGSSVDELHRAFMASSTHRQNILGSYTHVG